MSSSIIIGKTAPNFKLETFEGEIVELSEFKEEKIVLLVFNRGFTWPYCRAHMSQLRDDHSKFLDRDSVVLVIGPEKAGAFNRYWKEHNLPYIGLPDPRHTVLKLYGQQIKMLKFGRMPAQAIIDKKGIVRYMHYGKSMSDIPDNSEILVIIDNINS